MTTCFLEVTICSDHNIHIQPYVITIYHLPQITVHTVPSMAVLPSFITFHCITHSSTQYLS